MKTTLAPAPYRATMTARKLRKRNTYPSFAQAIAIGAEQAGWPEQKKQSLVEMLLSAVGEAFSERGDS